MVEQAALVVNASVQHMVESFGGAKKYIENLLGIVAKFVAAFEASVRIQLVG